MKKNVYVSVLPLLLVIVFCLLFIGQCAKYSKIVSRVIDGDTFVLKDSTHVRLIGIDTPEKKDPFFDSATAYVKAFVHNEKVRLEFDETKTGVFGRTLAYVYIGDICLNEELLKSGLATVTDKKYRFSKRDIYLSIEAEAKRLKKGKWKN